MNEDDKEEQPISESLNFDKPDFVFLPKEQHDWRQQGPYLVCKSCEITHTTYIGMDKVMVGINKEGQPIFKNRAVSITR